MITIAELEQLDTLDLALVAGRSGSSRSIRWVASSELAEPARWLRGGELVLTTGLGPAAATSLDAYVEGLAAAGIAGVGYAVGIHQQEVPNALVAAAERHGFPILRVPYATSFVSITEAVMTRIVNEQYAQLERAMTLHDALVRLVIDDAGLDAILAATAAAIGGEVRVIPTGPGPTSSDDASIVTLEVGLSGSGGTSLVARLPRAARDWDRAQLQQARTVVALELAKRSAVAEAERRVSGDLVDDLVSGSLEESAGRRRLGGFGIDETAALAVLVARPPSAALAAELRAGALVAAGSGAIATIRHGEVCLVLAVTSDADAVRRAVDIHETLARAGHQATIGVSRAHPRVRGVREAYDEAWYALEARAGAGRSAPRVATPRDLGSVGLILALQDERGLQLFVEATLGPLAAPQRATHAVLLEALASFIACNGHVSAAAERLGAHRHTLRHRLKRIEAMTGRRLDDADDRHDLWLALRARDVLARSRSVPPAARV